jgi:hypothetical protein
MTRLPQAILQNLPHTTEHGLLAQVSSTSSVWQRSSRFGIARM